MDVDRGRIRICRRWRILFPDLDCRPGSVFFRRDPALVLELLDYALLEVLEILAGFDSAEEFRSLFVV